MKFSIQKTRDLIPCIIRDADGLDLGEDVVSGDTETGVCWVYLRGMTGALIKGKWGFVQAEKKFKAPLSIEPLSQKSKEYLEHLTKMEALYKANGKVFMP